MDVEFQEQFAKMEQVSRTLRLPVRYSLLMPLGHRPGI